MIRAKIQYDLNKGQIDEYGKLYTLMENKLPVLSAQREEILRAQIVMAVSAFDTFIHDIVRIGLIQIFDGKRSLNKKTESYCIPFADLLNIHSTNSLNDKHLILENAIRRINSKDSYQSPISIEFALGLIGISSVWTCVSPKMGKPAQDIKKELGNIVRRRNQISHESDINPATMKKFAITESDSVEIVTFLDNLILSIYSLL